MNLLDFIKEFADRKNAFTRVVLEWYWSGEGIDEEYSFEGTPDEFVQRYTKEYDCLDGLTIFDVHKLDVVNEGLRSRICIEIVKE